MSVAGSTIPDQAIGRKQSAILLPESSIGTINGALSGGDRFDFLSLNINDTVDKLERVDKRQFPNIAEVALGKRSVAWDLEAYALTNGAGVLPDIDRVFQAASMTATVVPATSVTYNFTNTLVPTAILSDNEIVSQLAYGAVVQELGFVFSGNDFTKITASGIASYSVRTGTSELTANAAAAATAISVTDASLFEVGGYIQAGADNNTNDGYQVTAIDEGLNTIDITPALVVGASLGDAVGPLIPDLSTAGSSQTGIAGSITLAGNTLCMTDGSVTITSEYGSQQDKFGVQSYDVNPVLTDRRVNATFTLYGRRSNLTAFVNAARIGTEPLVVTSGDTAPNRFEVSIPQFQIEVDNLDIPETEFVTLTLTGKGLISAGNDELSVIYY